MHILKWEIKAQFKTLLIWSVVFIVLIFMMTSEFSAYYDNPEMSDVLDAMPEGMLKAFSMENANLTTTTGYISLVALYFYIMVGVYAVLLGNGIIAKEERDKTAEYLLTLPVSRRKLLFIKWLAALINTVFLSLVIFAATTAAMQPYDLDQAFFKFLTQITVSCFIIMLIFLSIGYLMASVLKRYKSSGKLSAVLVFILYLVNVIMALSDKLDFMKYLTPFKYFEAQKILKEGSFDTTYLIISGGIVIISMITAFIIYPKRDIKI